MNLPGPDEYMAENGGMAKPPNDRGQGRKPLQAGVETVIVSIRLTPEQAAKLKRLGGGEWVRERVKKAKEPDERQENAQ
jgi:hypothetical protein